MTHKLHRLHGKSNFAEISKNIVKYRSENNFIGKHLCRKFKYDEQCRNKFLYFSYQLEHSTLKK